MYFAAVLSAHEARCDIMTTTTTTIHHVVDSHGAYIELGL